MKKISCSVLLAFAILTFGPVVKAQMQRSEAPSACATDGKYPVHPEQVLAGCVLALVNKNLNADPLIVSEAEKLKTPEAQSELQKFLKENVEIGDEAQKAYRFSYLLKYFVVNLGKDDQPTINQQLMMVKVEQTEKTMRRCPPFLCVFRICC